MGLNMDVGPMFAPSRAAREQFDGARMPRPASPTFPRFGQIAGRAGRYMNDGNLFLASPTADCEAVSRNELVAADREPISTIGAGAAMAQFRIGLSQSAGPQRPVWIAPTQPGTRIDAARPFQRFCGA